MYVSYYDEIGPMDVLKKKRWLASTINPKTSQFNTLDQLNSAGVISDAEMNFYQGPLPGRELVEITRHQTYDKKEFLISSERSMGLSASGSVITISANNLDFTKGVQFEPDIVPIHPEQPKGTNARIVRVGKCIPGYEMAQKIYLTPFTKGNVEAAMQKAQRPTESSLHGRYIIDIIKIWII